MVGEGGTLPLPWLAGPLQEALARARGHALLLEARAGDGALEHALTLAQAWLCEGQGVAAPCGRCEACRLVNARTHPDLDVQVPEVTALQRGWAVDIEGSRKPSRQIKIDGIRGALERLSTSSARGRAKVLVVHPADAMNITAASALLKTLEEPAPRVRILLSVPDAARLMPTVRSRCQRLPWRGPSEAEATAWLMGQGVKEPERLLGAAGGQPLEALAWHQAGWTAAQWAQWPHAVREGQEGAWSGWPLGRVVDALQRLCHDAMAVAAGGVPRFFPADSAGALVGAAAQGTTMKALARWADTLQRVARNVDHPWSEGLAIDALMAEGRAALSSTRASSAVRGRGASGPAGAGHLATLRL
jgi:DNA polymerase-3 subunit delta'